MTVNKVEDRSQSLGLLSSTAKAASPTPVPNGPHMLTSWHDGQEVVVPHLDTVAWAGRARAPFSDHFIDGYKLNN